MSNDNFNFMRVDQLSADDILDFANQVTSTANIEVANSNVETKEAELAASLAAAEKLRKEEEAAAAAKAADEAAEAARAAQAAEDQAAADADAEAAARAKEAAEKAQAELEQAQAEQEAADQAAAEAAAKEAAAKEAEQAAKEAQAAKDAAAEAAAKEAEEAEAASTSIPAPSPVPPPIGVPSQNVVSLNYMLGTPNRKWKAVWAVNGTILTSDAKDKHHIKDSELGLDFIKALRPVSFKLRVEAQGKRHYGFVAQELDTCLKGRSFGGLVDSESGYGVVYTELIAPLVKAVQEQQEQIEELKEQVRKLLG